jgi:hypothetical protein
MNTYIPTYKCTIVNILLYLLYQKSTHLSIYPTFLQRAFEVNTSIIGFPSSHISTHVTSYFDVYFQFLMEIKCTDSETHSPLKVSLVEFRLVCYIPEPPTRI